MPHREFGDYAIQKKIGSGAMADVYLAEQKSLGRHVALKILKPDLAQDETHLHRFVQEARTIAALTHPNLVQIFQADCLDGYWFIAQEYVPGQSLQQLIQNHGPLPCVRVADILWQISSALEKAAQASIVHRDIKPDNILLGDNGDVKLADFGLARMDESENGAGRHAMGLTQTGMTLGTPLYMSPEQAQGKKLDDRSDQYSLGISCYHALTGRPPFRGETALAVALMHVNDKPEILDMLRPDIPLTLARIVHRMIEKVPGDRFQSFHDVQRALQKFYAEGLDNAETVTRLTGWNYFVHNMPYRSNNSSADMTPKAAIQESRHARRPLLRVWARILFMLVLGYLLGIWWGGTTPIPLHEPTVKTIRRRATVEEQWVYACMLNNAEAWQAVIDYFPEYYYFWGRKAKRQLIRYYFHSGGNGEGDTSNALPLFREMAELSDLDLEDQALGLAGLAWCAAEGSKSEADLELAQEYLRRLYGLDFSYDDELLIQILDAANRTIQRKQGTEVRS